MTTIRWYNFHWERAFIIPPFECGLNIKCAEEMPSQLGAILQGLATSLGFLVPWTGVSDL